MTAFELVLKRKLKANVDVEEYPSGCCVKREYWTVISPRSTFYTMLLYVQCM